MGQRPESLVATSETLPRRFNLRSKYVLLFAATCSKKERKQLAHITSQQSNEIRLRRVKIPHTHGDAKLAVKAKSPSCHPEQENTPCGCFRVELSKICNKLLIFESQNAVRVLRIYEGHMIRP